MKRSSTVLAAVAVAIVIGYFAYQKSGERPKQDYINAAYLTHGLATASHLKMLATMYWANSGELPCSNQDFDFPETVPEVSAGLTNIALTACGEITMTYTQASGNAGGKLVLRAREVAGATGKDLTWDCETSDYPDIEEFIPQCKYRPDLKTSRPQMQNTDGQDTPGTPLPEATDALARPDCRDGTVLHRSVFTDAVSKRVPQRRFAALGPDDNNIIFFTEIIGARGKRVTHRWYHDDSLISEISFDIKADRWRTWSSKQIETLTPGVLRVEVLNRNCLIGQESVQIAAETRLDPGTRTGWMRPMQALETALAREAAQPAENSRPGRLIDGRNASGDTWLTAAIRSGDKQEALKLIWSHDPARLNEYERLSQEELEKYSHMANPFLRDRDGVSPIDLAHRNGQRDIVEALIESAISPRKASRRAGRGRDVGMWGDSLIDQAASGTGGTRRFADGDTALIRAARQGDERAVLTLLALGRHDSDRQFTNISERLFAYDASGLQPLDIALENDHYGIERFLQMSLSRLEPGWSLSRATIATHMNGDEPGDCRRTAFADEPELYFFAELTDMQGKQASHQWRFNGETIQSTPFDIKSQRWKTQSQRQFSPDEVGTWELRVVDGTGNVLGTRRFRYQALTPRIEKNRKSYIGKTACDLGGNAMYALVRAHAPISKVQYLIDKGATLQPGTRRFDDLLLIAIESGSITWTRWFLDRGVDVDARAGNSSTPLAIAAEAGDVPMALFLIARGADVNKKRYQDKLTALQVASYNLNVGVANVLLENGADPNVPDREGFTALHRAVNQCSAILSVALLEHGADPVAMSKRGNTPKDSAANCVSNKRWQPGSMGLESLISQEKIK